MNWKPPPSDAVLRAAARDMYVALLKVLSMHATPGDHYRDHIGAMNQARDVIKTIHFGSLYDNLAADDRMELLAALSKELRLLNVDEDGRQRRNTPAAKLISRAQTALRVADRKDRETAE